MGLYDGCVLVSRASFRLLSRRAAGQYFGRRRAAARLSRASLAPLHFWGARELAAADQWSAKRAAQTCAGLHPQK